MPTATATAPGAPVSSEIPMCDDVPYITAPAEYYRDTPIYVGNPPDNEVRDWARQKTHFEVLWIDREHHGWLTLAFSQDAAARQEELESELPEVGAVAVEVDWTMAELEALQQRVRPLMPELAYSSGIPVNKGVVSIGIGPLTAERIAAVEERFAGERVCLEGIDPALLPPEGPQQPAGDGWRLLADQDETGQPYRTGIAFDDSSYAELWRKARLTGDRPAVDFQSEVVIWFGAVHGSSCPHLRLDDVVVDRERALVYADIALLDQQMACTADAIGQAYVVALLRSKLPGGPFAIQLDSSGPPAGAPEERTIVDVDLSQPGAIAEPGEVHGDPNLPEPYFVGPGDFVEPGYETAYRQSTHCGLEWLGPLNDVNWRTDVPAGAIDWIPTEWRSKVTDESMQLNVLIETEPEPTLTATAKGHSVIYRATVEEPPGCD